MPLASTPGLSLVALARLARRLRCSERRRGRPWALPLAERLAVAVTSLRTALTVRELAAVFAISPSQAHRIVTDLVPRLATLLRHPVDSDRHATWIVDGTLIPTRDHAVAARAKNYRWSCNIQVLVRHRDRRVVAIAGGGPGNRNDPVHYRGSTIQALCRRHRDVLADGGYRGIHELRTPRFRNNRIVRDAAWRVHRRRRARVEHVLARLKDWRVLRDHRRRGRHLLTTVRAVAYLYNLNIELRNGS